MCVMCVANLIPKTEKDSLRSCRHINLWLTGEETLTQRILRGGVIGTLPPPQILKKEKAKGVKRGGRRIGEGKMLGLFYNLGGALKF